MSHESSEYGGLRSRSRRDNISNPIETIFWCILSLREIYIQVRFLLKQCFIYIECSQPQIFIAIGYKVHARIEIILYKRSVLLLYLFLFRANQSYLLLIGSWLNYSGNMVIIIVVGIVFFQRLL